MIKFIIIAFVLFCILSKVYYTIVVCKAKSDLSSAKSREKKAFSAEQHQVSYEPAVKSNIPYGTFYYQTEAGQIDLQRMINQENNAMYEVAGNYKYH